jgi:two-component system, chemotaxis family, response regulator PixG
VVDLKEKSNQSLVNQLVQQKQKQFTGQMIVQAPSDMRWILHFRTGHLVWATGGKHIVRRLYRHLSQQCPQVDFEMLAIREDDRQSCGWDYQVLSILVCRQVIAQEDAQIVIANLISEVLFDILQYHQFIEFLTYDYKSTKDAPDMATSSIVMLDVEQIMVKTMENWSAWQKANLGFFLLHLAPVLSDLEALKKSTSARSYKNLVKLINGKRTLRNLAALMKKDEMVVVRSLFPLIQRGLVRLVELPDLHRPKPPQKGARTRATDTIKNKHLIACVDDSRQVCWQLHKILKKAGHRLIRIQDPLKALFTLVESKPSLIFLDLVMPVVSGYELCTQLRRVAELQQIPIVILTSQDGIVDRVRAKIVGATGFMSKPIKEEKVLAVIEKYLANPKATSKSQNNNGVAIKTLPPS